MEDEPEFDHAGDISEQVFDRGKYIFVINVSRLHRPNHSLPKSQDGSKRSLLFQVLSLLLLKVLSSLLKTKWMLILRSPIDLWHYANGGLRPLLTMSTPV